MEKKCSVLLISALLCGTVVMSSTTLAWAQQKPFKIGYVGGFSGPWAIYNTRWEIGIKFAIDEINKSGGFQGRKIELITRDGKERPDVSMSEARDLILTHGVDVLIGCISGAAALAVSTISKEQKIPYFCGGGTLVTGKDGHRYVFKLAGMDSDMNGFSMGEFLAEKPWKSYYLIGSDYVFPHEVLGYVWKRLSERKPDVKKVGEFWPKVGERDFTNYITAIMAANPEAVIALQPGSMGMDFKRQAKGFNFYSKIQLIDCLLTTSDLTPLGKETPEGIIGLTEYPIPYCSEKYPLAKKIEQKYDQAYKDYDYICVMSGYTTMLFLWEAVKKSGSTDKEKIVDALEGLETDTPVGPYKILNYSHRGTRPLFIGTTTFSQKYPVAVYKNVKVYQGEKIMFSESEIRKMRGE